MNSTTKFFRLLSNRLFLTPTRMASNFRSIKYETNQAVATITLNRPERFNAIDHFMPSEIRQAVEAANDDASVKVIVITGAGKAFCSGYDLKIFAESPRGSEMGSQEMPWDPYEDYKWMKQATDDYMSLWRSLKPTIAKVNGVAVAGGSDIALCCDLIFMNENAVIGYPPARVWGCPTTAMWIYRIGLEHAKRLLLTGDVIPAHEAERIGLISKSVPSSELDEYVEDFLTRLTTVPTNQLFFQKQLVNNAYEMMGITATQRLSTLFDGMTRHTPEGVEFQERCNKVGFKKAVLERDAPNKSKI